MMRSILIAQNEFAGMSAGKVLSARLTLPSSRYPKAADLQQFCERLSTRLVSAPGAIFFPARRAARIR